MADETNTPPVDEESEQPAQTEQPSRAAGHFWRRFWSPKWLAILLGGSIVLHGMGIAYSRLLRASASTKPAVEVGLGSYKFVADQAEQARIGGATFSLHIALLPQVDRVARAQLEDRKFRVQQEVEQLLRRAHGGDFDDPALGELKRQLQERINETLGMRAISDVIITDLRLRRAASEPQPQAPAQASGSETASWMDQPSH